MGGLTAEWIADIPTAFQKTPALEVFLGRCFSLPQASANWPLVYRPFSPSPEVPLAAETPFGLLFKSNPETASGEAEPVAWLHVLPVRMCSGDWLWNIGGVSVDAKWRGKGLAGALLRVLKEGGQPHPLLVGGSMGLHPLERARRGGARPVCLFLFAVDPRVYAAQGYLPGPPDSLCDVSRLRRLRRLPPGWGWRRVAARALGAGDPAFQGLLKGGPGCFGDVQTPSAERLHVMLQIPRMEALILERQGKAVGGGLLGKGDDMSGVFHSLWGDVDKVLEALPPEVKWCWGEKRTKKIFDEKDIHSSNALMYQFVDAAQGVFEWDIGCLFGV